MKAVILCGGLGTRLSEETETKPKPMVEIGGRPILWHILKHYAHYGFREFFIALGYKGEVFKHYFLDYSALDGDMTVRLDSREIERHGADRDQWVVHLIDTGQNSSTGGRPELLDIGVLPYGDGDPMFVCADNRRLTAETGWGPAYDLESGLRESIQRWRRRLSAPTLQVDSGRNR